MPRKGENIYKRKDGRWEGRYAKSKSSSGKTNYGYVYGKTYREAKAKLIAALANCDKIDKLSSENTTSFDTIAWKWYDSNVATVKVSTSNKYRNLLTKYILPVFGGMSLSSVTCNFIEDQCKIYLNSCGSKGQGLSPKTVADILSVIRNILRYADNHGIVVSSNLSNIRIKQNSKCEYIQYAQEVEQALSQLEATLHNCDDPEEIITNMLVAATEFYDGDWAGIMDADLTMKVWSTLWWYNRRTQGMTPNSFTDLQEGEYLTRWIESLLTGTPMIIENIEDLAETSELEYSFLKSIGVQTVIAVPFWKRPTGFLIVRNPKRYLNRSSLLQMMAFVAVSSVNEKRLMDCIKLKLVPDTITKDTDIIINIFDELQIITSKGIITDKELKSPKISKLIVYLLLHTRRPASPYEIVRDLWPDDDLNKASINVKSLVYRLQQTFSLVSDYRLIESTGSGYWLTPDLNIMSDLNIFDDLWHEAQITADPQTKGHLLKKAMDLYKGGPLEAYRGEHWFMPTVAHYALRYTGIINQLLSNLNRANDYVRILEYANIAIKATPGSADAFYWVIYAMNHLGMGEVAKNELKAAKQVLTEKDYEDLLQKLNMQAV